MSYNRLIICFTITIQQDVDFRKTGLNDEQGIEVTKAHTLLDRALVGDVALAQNSTRLLHFGDLEGPMLLRYSEQ